MGLSRKEINSVARNTTTFYLYKDNATSEDLIKIIDKMPETTPGFTLLPIIKTITEYKLDILNDEVKYEMLYKIGLKSQRFSYLQQIVDMFQMYKVSVSDTVINKLVDETLVAKMSSHDKDCQMWSIINCLKPKFSNQNIEKIMATPRFNDQTKMLEYLLKQLVADKNFTTILEHKELFDYAVKNKREIALQVVKSALDTKQLDVIAEKSQAYFDWENGILFSEELLEQMIALCLKEHRTDLIFDISAIFHYATNTKPELAKKAVQQLVEDKKELYISSNSRVLAYVLKNEPRLLKKLSSFQKTSIKTAKKEQTLALLEEMSLPNADLEFAYIKRNNNADAKFPSKEKLSPETLDYINIINGKYEMSTSFKRLTPRVISALIDCHFNNQADWYKVMEQLLRANPNLDTKFIQQMLNQDKKVEVLIKRYWKGGLRKMLIKKFISEKKHAFMKAFRIKQKKR